MPGYDFSGFVDGIMPAFQQMAKSAKEKELYERQLSQVDAWTKQGVNQKTGQIEPIVDGVKNKDIIPFANQKALDSIKSSKTHSIAQKRGELDAYAAMVKMNIQNELRRAAKEPRIPTQVVPGTEPLPLTPSSRAQVLLTQQQREEERKRYEASGRKAAKVEERAAAGEVRAQAGEKRAGQAELRAEGAYTREDEKVRVAQLEKAPEIQFQRKYGTPPQAFASETPIENEYTAVSKGGREMATLRPLKLGEKPPAADRNNFFSWLGASAIGMGDEWTPERGGWKPKGDVYRLSEDKYSAHSNQPERLKYRVDPEGDFLHYKGSIIPMHDVGQMQQQAAVRQAEVQQALKTKPIEAIRQRLTDWGYDPDNDYWGLPK